VKDPTVARSYASALFEIGQRYGETEAYAAPFQVVAATFRADPRVARFFETPRIPVDAKRAALRRALEGRVPDRFLHFALVVMSRGRQRLFPEIAEAYQEILDRESGRVHAQVTLAREPDAAMQRLLTSMLTELIGQPVDPQVVINPAILGGLVVRYGDRLLDGSLRRQMVRLRRRLIHSGLPEHPAASVG
jgi:F-type H+-transporting ATPase subunit delta